MLLTALQLQHGCLVKYASDWVSVPFFSTCAYLY